MSTATQTKSLVVVAIPAEDDRVWKISSQKVPHLTLLFLGDADKVSNFASIVEFVQHAASTSLQRVYLPVDRRGELGMDKADVLFFKKGRYDFKAVRDFRNLLLKDSNIKTAFDSTSQFEFPEEVGAAGQPWIPHLTLGYPDSPAKPIPDDQMSTIYDVRFDRIAVWDGDFEGPEFELKDYWDEMDELGIDMDAPLSVAWSGVKGMKWGHITSLPGAENLKVSEKTGMARVSNKSLAKLVGLSYFAFLSPTVRNETKAAQAHNVGVKADAKWQKQIDRSKKGMEVHNKAADEINSKLPAFNGDKRWQNSEGGRDISKDPAKLDEYNKAFEREVMNPAYSNAAVKVYGSKSPTDRYTFEVKDAATGLLSVTDTTKVKHAADDELSLKFKLVRDANGLISNLVVDEEDAEMAHADDTPDLIAMVDAGAEFIEHYGTKGMHWGQRKSAPTAVTPTATSHVPHGRKRKTKIETEGGENHEAAPDAIKVAQHRAKLAKSGPNALSNKELQEVANRVELEQRVKRAVQPAGKKFVGNFLKGQGQQGAQALGQQGRKKAFGF